MNAKNVRLFCLFHIIFSKQLNKIKMKTILISLIVLMISCFHCFNQYTGWQITTGRNWPRKDCCRKFFTQKQVGAAVRISCSGWFFIHCVL